MANKKYVSGENLSRVLAKIKTLLDGKASNSAATTSAPGLMSADDKKKLDGIDTGANKYTYTHPTGAGSKHIPSGGSTGQILRWKANGEAQWGADNNTTYNAFSGATASAAGEAGLVPAPAAGENGEFLRGDGTWAVPTNTTYVAATQSAQGLMSANDKKKLDGIASGANDYTHPAYTARTGKPTANQTPGFGSTFTVSQVTSDAAGHVTGMTDRTVKIPNTAASQSAAGLMSATDKAKLDGIETVTTAEIDAAIAAL